LILSIVFYENAEHRPVLPLMFYENVAHKVDLQENERQILVYRWLKNKEKLKIPII